MQMIDYVYLKIIIANKMINNEKKKIQLKAQFEF